MFLVVGLGNPGKEYEKTRHNVGFEVVEALQAGSGFSAWKTSGNAQVELAMDDVYASVKSGGSIAAPIEKNPLFPAMVGHMVAVGEETGQLEHMMTKIADFYEEQVEAAVKALTSILEPIMILFVGGIVGFIVIAMYLPMLSLYDKIR